jgi:hypothetical protein
MQKKTSKQTLVYYLGIINLLLLKDATYFSSENSQVTLYLLSELNFFPYKPHRKHAGKQGKITFLSSSVDKKNIPF